MYCLQDEAIYAVDMPVGCASCRRHIWGGFCRCQQSPGWEDHRAQPWKAVPHEGDWATLSLAKSPTKRELLQDSENPKSQDTYIQDIEGSVTTLPFLVSFARLCQRLYCISLRLGQRCFSGWDGVLQCRDHCLAHLCQGSVRWRCCWLAKVNSLTARRCCQIRGTHSCLSLFLIIH